MLPLHRLATPKAPRICFSYSVVALGSSNMNCGTDPSRGGVNSGIVEAKMSYTVKKCLAVGFSETSSVANGIATSAIARNS